MLDLHGPAEKVPLNLIEVILAQGSMAKVPRSAVPLARLPAIDCAVTMAHQKKSVRSGLRAAHRPVALAATFAVMSLRVAAQVTATGTIAAAPPSPQTADAVLPAVTVTGQATPNALGTVAERLCELSPDEHHLLGQVHDMITDLRESTRQAWGCYQRMVDNTAKKD